MPATLERQQPTGGGGGMRGRVGMPDRRRVRELEHAIVATDRLAPIAIRLLAEDGEDRAAHAPGPHPREVEMPGLPPLDQLGMILACERVGVTVEHWERRSRLLRLHGRGSIAAEAPRVVRL